MKKIETTAIALCGMVIASVLCLGMAPTAVRATVLPPVNISKLAGFQAETTIAIDPTNTNRMFAASNIGTGNGMFAAYSTDGGVTWAYTDPVDKVIGDGAGTADNVPLACCDPVAVFDRFGNLYLAYLSSGIAVRVVVSTNGGQSFTGTNFADVDYANIDVKGKSTFSVSEKEQKGGGDDPDDVINQSGDQPTIVTGPSFFAGEASVWISWNGGGVIRAAGTRASALGAITPFDNTFIATPVAGNFGDIEIGPLGQVLVTAQSPSSGQGPSNINVSLDPDGLGPLNFTQMPSIPLGHKPFYLTDTENFGASILVTATNVGGFDVIPAQPNRTVDAEADLSWDRTGGLYNGRVYLAYTEETAPENNDLDILVRYSNSNGATWSAPVRVNDDATTRSQFFPKIEVDQTTGGIAVAFYDARNDAGGTDGVANTEAQVFGALSFTGGTTFGINEQISPGSSRSPSFGNPNEYGDYNGLAFRNNRYFYIWADNSNSTGDNPNGTRTSPDIYTARVTVAAPTAAMVSLGGRVLTSDGRGVRNASVQLTDSTGTVRQVLTSSFGYYRFDDVSVGQTYVVAVASKRFAFTARTLTVADELTEVDFVAQ